MSFALGILFQLVDLALSLEGKSSSKLYNFLLD